VRNAPDQIRTGDLRPDIDDRHPQRGCRRYVDLDAVDRYVGLLRRDASFADDLPGPPPIRCRDPDDDYLIALAHARAAALVSGDDDLLELVGQIPVFTPAEFLAAQD
jgi:predicted nucleic acid-binding protein